MDEGAREIVPATPAVSAEPWESVTRSDLLRVTDEHRLLDEFVSENLKEGLHYGVFPGVTKRCLFKAGADELCRLYRLLPSYEILECPALADLERGVYRYTVRVRLTKSSRPDLFWEGLGECNSLEPQYRYRWLWPWETTEEERAAAIKKREITSKKGRRLVQFSLPNPDPAGQANTLMKMAKKRALVDAAIAATHTSSLFTQDLEDRKEIDVTPAVDPEEGTVMLNE